LKTLVHASISAEANLLGEVRPSGEKIKEKHAGQKRRPMEIFVTESIIANRVPGLRKSWGPLLSEKEASTACHRRKASSAKGGAEEDRRPALRN